MRLDDDLVAGARIRACSRTRRSRRRFSGKGIGICRGWRVDDNVTRRTSTAPYTELAEALTPPQFVPPIDGVAILFEFTALYRSAKTTPGSSPPRF